MRRSVELQRIGTRIGKVLEHSLSQAPAGEAPILAWPLVCGSRVAERTRAVAFASGKLCVEVPDQGWRHELMLLAPRYLAVMNLYVPEAVNRIEFVVKPR